MHPRWVGKSGDILSWRRIGVEVKGLISEQQGYLQLQTALYISSYSEIVTLKAI